MCIGIERQARRHRPRAEHGISLIELIVFIVIVGIAVAGVVGALSMATRASADPMIQKQALAIAEALLEEVQLQPFTYCDPDDPQAATAQSAAVGATGCTEAGSVENLMAAETTPPYGPESRTSATNPYDNVNDYNSLPVMTGITDLTGAAIPGLGGYTATVSVANQALAPVPASESLLITVTVLGPTGTNTTVVLDGYRVRYAPNALP
ncbi:MAG: type II secretion system protein [Betaproteobacteria bacterium]|nr:MAG: type II secretion system protein [Betaproteobacteria bacterium]TMI07057.1 MAG: type II secretion system protein [Betaproteobacteria bacterium]